MNWCLKLKLNKLRFNANILSCFLTKVRGCLYIFIYNIYLYPNHMCKKKCKLSSATFKEVGRIETNCFTYIAFPSFVELWYSFYIDINILMAPPLMLTLENEHFHWGTKMAYIQYPLQWYHRRCLVRWYGV